MNIKRNIILNIIYIIVGTVLVVLGAMEILNNLYSGFGGGIAGVGIVQLIRNIQYATNKELKEKVDTEINDERNKYIRMKAWSWTGYIVVLALAITSIVMMIIGKELYCEMASFMMCMVLIVYYIAYFIIRRKN